MNIIDAITRVDALKPNGYRQSEKIWWLSMLDWTVKREIIDTHEGGEGVVFNGYNDETLLTTELPIPAPYEEAYIHYLEMKIDYANGEYGKYNNSLSMFEAAFDAFKKYYNREHKPIGRGRRFLF